MMKKIFKIIIALVITAFLVNIEVLAQDENVALEQVGESLQLDKYLNVFKMYIQENDINELNINEMYTSLVSGNGVNYQNLSDIFISNLFKQIKSSATSVTTLFVIIVVMAILTNLQLDKDSDVVKISRLIIVMCVGAILLKNYIEIVQIFNNIIKILSNSMQVVAVFLTGILVASGKITSVGIIQPLLLFVASFICVVTQYIVVPFFTISIAINIISKISTDIKLDKMSGIFRKSSLCIFSSIIAVFVLILSMETTITKSIDGIYFKTTQNIVSDVVPVVGKFLSDSLDTVLGATELIGKAGGIIALIVTILIVSVPVIKIFVVYKILAALSEPINEDKILSEFINGFADVYKDMLGILIGITILFVMATGIIMSMLNYISG